MSHRNVQRHVSIKVVYDLTHTGEGESGERGGGDRVVRLARLVAIFLKNATSGSCFGSIQRSSCANSPQPLSRLGPESA